MLFPLSLLLKVFNVYTGGFMNKKKNTAKEEEKDKTGLPANKEDFNTGSHSPSSLRDVNAGYDDTGMGNNEKASGRKKDDKKVNSAKSKKKTGR